MITRHLAPPKKETYTIPQGKNHPLRRRKNSGPHPRKGKPSIQGADF
jgi:hypothetical protein